MKHVTAIMGMWLDKLAVDQLFFHVAMFNCQNPLLHHPYTSCPRKLPKAYRGKAGRCLRSTDRKRGGQATGCSSTSRQATECFRMVIHLSSGEVFCKLICMLCGERMKVL